jgi:hypothetical protein
MKRAVSLVVFSTFAVLLSAADFKKTALITVPQTIELKASPASVWDELGRLRRPDRVRADRRGEEDFEGRRQRGREGVG